MNMCLISDQIDFVIDILMYNRGLTMYKEGVDCNGVFRFEYLLFM